MQSRVEVLERLHDEIKSCHACPLPDSGPHRFAGTADNRIMLVGQAPAKPRGPEGRPFGRGNGRQKLFEWLVKAGYTEEEFRARAYMTSVTKCYPGPSPGGKGDRRPNKAEIAACSSFLDRELDLIRPKVLILVGQLAIETLLGDLKLSEAVGRRFERDFGGWSATIIPLPHPSGTNLWNNLPENQALVERAMELLGELREKLGL